MLIDSSYFTKGSRHILNASVDKPAMPNYNSVDVNGVIEGYIVEYQEEYLTAMLGHTEGHRVNAYLVCLDEEEDREHIRNLDAVCDQLRESFADYVFFKMLRDMNTQSTVTGLVRLKCANEYVSPIRRQVSAWNAMVDKNRRFEEWRKTEECHLSGIRMEESMLEYINCLNL